MTHETLRGWTSTEVAAARLLYEAGWRPTSNRLDWDLKRPTHQDRYLAIVRDLLAAIGEGGQS